MSEGNKLLLMNIYSLGMKEISGATAGHHDFPEAEEKHFEVYKSAIEKDAVVPMQYLKCFLVGIPQIGKTAVRYRLAGSLTNIQSIGGKANWRSTPIAESSFVKVSQSTIAVVEGESPETEWSNVEEEKELNEIMALINCYCNKSEDSTKKKEHPDETSPKEDPKATSKNKAALHEDASQPSILLHGIPSEVKEAVQAFKEKLKKAGPQSLNSIKKIQLLLMIDVGGQSEFLEMLPLLMCGPAIYLTFFNISEASLDQTYYNKSNFVGGADCYDEDKQSVLTLGDVIIQILSNVAFSAHPKEAVARALQIMFDQQNSKQDVEKFHSAVALLIGTHKDKLIESLRESCSSQEELDERLQKELKGIDKEFEKKIKEVFCRSDMSHVVYVNPVKKNLVFAMDNMNGGKEEIDILRKRLMDEAEKFHKIKIPLRWLVLGIILRKEYVWITKKDCVHIATELEIDGEIIDSVLWFLSSVTGMLLFQPNIPGDSHLKNVILCNPQIIFDSISAFIIKRVYCDTGDPDQIDRLRELGQFAPDELSESDQGPEDRLQKSMRRSDKKQSIPFQQLIQLLEYRKIVAPCSDEHYIMPAILTCKLKEEFLEESEASNDTPCPLFINFERFGYAPLGFFSCILTQLISECKSEDNELSLDEESVRRNHIAFYDGFGNRISVFAHAKWYEVVCVYEPGEQNVTEFCHFLKQFFQRIIGSIIRDLNFSVKHPDLCLKCEGSPKQADHFFSIFDVEKVKDPHSKPYMRCKDKCKGKKIVLLERQLCWMSLQQVGYNTVYTSQCVTRVYYAL